MLRMENSRLQIQQENNTTFVWKRAGALEGTALFAYISRRQLTARSFRRVINEGGKGEYYSAKIGKELGSESMNLLKMQDDNVPNIVQCKWDCEPIFVRVDVLAANQKDIETKPYYVLPLNLVQVHPMGQTLREAAEKKVFPGKFLKEKPVRDVYTAGLNAAKELWKRGWVHRRLHVDNILYYVGSKRVKILHVGDAMKIDGNWKAVTLEWMRSVAKDYKEYASSFGVAVMCPDQEARKRSRMAKIQQEQAAAPPTAVKADGSSAGKAAAPSEAKSDAPPAALKAGGPSTEKSLAGKSSGPPAEKAPAGDELFLGDCPPVQKIIEIMREDDSEFAQMMDFFSKPTSELDEEDLPATFQDILKNVQEIVGLKPERHVQSSFDQLNNLGNQKMLFLGVLGFGGYILWRKYKEQEPLLLTLLEDEI